MPSYNFGKDKVCEWIREHFPADAEVLDVGACDGNMHQWLPEYKNMDAVEIWTPSAEAIKPLYREVFNANMVGLKIKKYDLIIMGDFIEHLSVEDAQKVIKYCKTRCTDMVVAVPFLYPQGEMYGNPYEEHLQPDLTAEVFAERYPGFEVLLDTGLNYCYYHKAPAKKKVAKNEQRN